MNSTPPTQTTVTSDKPSARPDRRIRLPSSEAVLFLLGVVILLWHIDKQGGPDALLEKIQPVKAYDFSLTTDFEPDDSDVNIHTYLPVSNARQKILTQEHYDNVFRRTEKDASGQKIHWIADPNSSQTRYQVRAVTKAMQFDIPEDLPLPLLPSTELPEYLLPTEFIQSEHIEISQLWQQIQPENTGNLLAVVRAIYDHTHKQLETVDFKGTTDALTAARLGVASCNGKSRLFVALARLNQLPARLVGGVILDSREKRTSHQWVEVYIQGYWVPFDPTNGHFAALPDNYLQLYTGDQPLIRHTSNINFDYRFDSKEVQISSIFHPGLQSPGDDSQIVQALAELDMSPQTIGLVLLFPLCSLLITFLRNVIGIKTFGIFMPMLIASACFYTGLTKGALGFGSLLLIAVVVYAIAERMHLLKTARLAIVLSCIVATLLIFLLYSDAETRFELGLLSVFPVVIISFIAERLNQSMGESDWHETLITSLGTLLTVLLCFILFQSMLLKNLFASLPALILWVLAVQVHLGKWSGIRLSEMLRFRQLLKSDSDNVAGINCRNRDIIYRFNDKHLLRLAADKLATKEALSKHAIPVPDTRLAIQHHSDIQKLAPCINQFPAFALKPNKGCQGNGIVIIKGKYQGQWQGSGKRHWNLDMLEAHVSDILSGVYSQSGDNDIAYIEPLLLQHDTLNRIAPYGLSDIRLIVARGRVISAMLRIPTKESGGKANLHQGAIGVAIDHATGLTTGAKYKGSRIDAHPDTSHPLTGVQIPDWNAIITMAENSYEAVPLGYLGVDICIDQQQGPLVLEVNGRPGLEIQNVNERGFYNDFLEKAYG